MLEIRTRLFFKNKPIFEKPKQNTQQTNDKHDNLKSGTSKHIPHKKKTLVLTSLAPVVYKTLKHNKLITKNYEN